MWQEITKENVESLRVGCLIRYSIQSEFTNTKGNGTFTKFTFDNREQTIKVWGYWNGDQVVERYVRLGPVYNLEYFLEVADLDQDDDDCI